MQPDGSLDDLIKLKEKYPNPEQGASFNAGRNINTFSSIEGSDVIHKESNIRNVNIDFPSSPKIYEIF